MNAKVSLNPRILAWFVLLIYPRVGLQETISSLFHVGIFFYQRDNQVNYLVFLDGEGETIELVALTL